MLREYPNVRQVAGKPPRRWFGEAYFDLIVWLDDRGDPLGFQLCYDKGERERALTWTRDKGYSHRRVDDGESFTSKRKQNPVLVADGLFDPQAVAERFRRASADLEPALAELVCRKLLDYLPG